MALAVRLIGRRRLLPSPLAAAVAHLSAASQIPCHHHHLLPIPALPLPPRELPPFTLHSRSFSWYSRSGSGSGSGLSAGTAAADAPGEDVNTEKESVCLDGVTIVDDGEGVASGAGAAAVAVGSAAGGTADGVGGVSELAVSTALDLMEGFHSLTGLPWWMTISFSTVAMRLLILPALIVQLQKTAKIGEVFRKLSTSLPPPQPGNNFREEYALFQKKKKEKKKELGCPSFLWNFAYFSVQFPCFILWMMTIRSMCLNNHPGFDDGGILWFHNLTEFPHGTLGPIFPILVAGLHYLNVQISFQGSQIKDHPGIFGMLAKYYRIYLNVLTIPLFLIAYVVPQGSLVYWTTNGLFSVAQQLSLRNGAARKLLGLPDTRAQVGYRAQKSPLEVPEMMQSTTPKGTASESTTPNFAMESMEGNISVSSSPEELLERALQYLGTGCRDQALPLIRTAVERNPDLSTALIGMGQTLFSNRMFPEAAVCFEHAIPKIQEDDPLLVLAYFGADLSYKCQGDNETAIKLLQRIAELKEPEKTINKRCYFQGMLTLGSILSGEGRHSEAAKYLRMAIAYDPSVERLLKECEEGMDDHPKPEEK